MSATHGLADMLSRLKAELDSIHFPKASEIRTMDLRTLLDILQFVLIRFSRLLTTFLLEKGFDLRRIGEGDVVPIALVVAREYLECRPERMAPQKELTAHEPSSTILEKRADFALEFVRKAKRFHNQLVKSSSSPPPPPQLHHSGASIAAQTKQISHETPHRNDSTQHNLFDNAIGVRRRGTSHHRSISMNMSLDQQLWYTQSWGLSNNDAINEMMRHTH